MENNALFYIETWPFIYKRDLENMVYKAPEPSIMIRVFLKNPQAF